MAEQQPGNAAPRISPAVDPDPEVVDILQKSLLTSSGEPLNVLATMARHPKLLKRFNVLGGALLFKGVLPPREREVVILRVGWACRSVYEFGQHTLLGEREGLTAQEIAALTKPIDAHPWSDVNRGLIMFADELCANNDVSDATWDALASRWNEQELIELLVVAGMYRLVSGFLNTLRVQLDEGVPGWPTA